MSKDDLQVTEGVAGMWFYHLSKGDEYWKALCGAHTMRTSMPLTLWGHKGHLNERYCRECEKLHKAAPLTRSPFATQ